MHQQTSEEAHPSQLEKIQEDEGVVEYGPHLRRTTRKIKKNPKHANAALVEKTMQKSLQYTWKHPQSRNGGR